MPSTLELADEFGDDLAVLFVEVQGAAKKKAEQFAWNQGWMATTAMWGNEQPLEMDTDKLPVFALLSGDGQVLLTGNPISMHAEIENAIKRDIKRAAQVGADVPKSLHGAWKSFQKGDYKKAFEAAIDIELPGDDDAPAAVEMLKGFRASIGARIEGIQWRIEHGHLLEAQDRLEDLAKSAKGLEEVEALLVPIQQKLESDDMRPEFDAAKDFAKVEARLKKDGLEDKWLRQLEGLLEKHPNTLAAERANQLLRLSKIQ